MLSTTGSFFPKIQVQPPKIKGTNGNSPYHTARRGSINSIEDASPEKLGKVKDAI